MNTETKPKYFRLLEVGEIIEKGDCFVDATGSLVKTGTPGMAARTGLPNTYLRPIIVDEWIDYNKQQPTEADGTRWGGLWPNGRVEMWFRDGSFGTHELGRGYESACMFWRRITPPIPQKPVQVKLLSEGGRELREIEVRPDGTAKLSCGDIVSAGSIDQFIKARKEVMKQ